MTKGEQPLYDGFFAEFYDILHAGLADVNSYIGFGHRFGPDILELGSGTGRILIPLANEGFNVTGVDSSDDMISRCLGKLALENEKARSRLALVNQDVTHLNLGKKFDLIIAPCNMMNHFRNPTDLAQVFHGVMRHLKKTGVFIFDVSIPNIPYMVYINGVERVFNFEHPLTGTRIVNRFVSTYDFVRQLEHNSIQLEEYDEANNLLRQAHHSGTMSYFFPRELRIMLESSGLSIFHEQGSLMDSAPIDDNSSEMVFFCRPSKNRQKGPI